MARPAMPLTVHLLGKYRASVSWRAVMPSAARSLLPSSRIIMSSGSLPTPFATSSLMYVSSLQTGCNS
jgi:hypothetical protein